jgi:rod shape-determining protein MreC
LSADVREGDVLLTSGMGRRFPPGFTIGTLGALRPDDSRAFLEGEVMPAAHLDRGRDVLLLRGFKPVAAKAPASASSSPVQPQAQASAGPAVPQPAPAQSVPAQDPSTEPAR